MVTKELRMAATEVNQILRYTEEADVNKIPLGLRLFLKEIADKKYIPEINPEISLNDQQLMTKTEQILGMLYCYYWSSEEELMEISNEIKEKAQETSNEISKEYTSTDFFDGEKKRVGTSLASQSLIETTKEPWYKRLFAWFKKK